MELKGTWLGIRIEFSGEAQGGQEFGSDKQMALRVLGHEEVA